MISLVNQTVYKTW